MAQGAKRERLERQELVANLKTMTGEELSAYLKARTERLKAEMVEDEVRRKQKQMVRRQVERERANPMLAEMIERLKVTAPKQPRTIKRRF